MRASVVATLCALGILSALPEARATDTSEMLDCWIPGFAGAWADFVDTEQTTPTDPGPPFAPARISRGFNFDDSDNNEIFCTWMVPDDFQAETGVLAFGGWFVSYHECGGGGCAGDGGIRWEVGWHAVAPGDKVWYDFNTTAFTQPVPAEVCLVGATDYCADRYISAGNACAPDAAIGDTVFFRIKRIPGHADDDVDAVFHLATVRFFYENP